MDHADLSSQITLIEPLTERELDVLRLMAEDLSIPAMAERLVLAPTTVKWYTQQIYGKLGIHEPGQKRRQAVARALGLLEVEKTLPGGLVTACPCRRRHSSVGRARSTPSPRCWRIPACGW